MRAVEVERLRHEPRPDVGDQRGGRASPDVHVGEARLARAAREWPRQPGAVAARKVHRRRERQHAAPADAARGAAEVEGAEEGHHHQEPQRRAAAQHRVALEELPHAWARADVAVEEQAEPWQLVRGDKRRRAHQCTPAQRSSSGTRVGEAEAQHEPGQRDRQQRHVVAAKRDERRGAAHLIEDRVERVGVAQVAQQDGVQQHELQMAEHGRPRRGRMLAGAAAPRITAAAAAVVVCRCDERQRVLLLRLRVAKLAKLLLVVVGGGGVVVVVLIEIGGSSATCAAFTVGDPIDNAAPLRANLERRAVWRLLCALEDGRDERH